MSEANIEQGRQVTEVHCRCCGSHLGHYPQVQGDVLHCINGAGFAFTAGEAG